METKYYLDEQGLIRTLQGISNKIKENTASNIRVDNVADPDTGEISKVVLNPDKFATVGAVYDYVTNQSIKKLTIVKKCAVENSETGYDVQNNISEYNGSDPTEIIFDIIRYSDIQSLFLTENNGD